MNKNQCVEILLEKRFGIKNPEEIQCLLEVNTFIPADEGDAPIGIGIQLILEDKEKGPVKEEYQINPEGVVFSWGNTPVIDERSLKQKL